MSKCLWYAEFIPARMLLSARKLTDQYTPGLAYRENVKGSGAIAGFFGIDQNPAFLFITAENKILI